MISIIGWTQYDPSGQLGNDLELDIDVHGEKDVESVKMIADLLVRDQFVSVLVFDEDDNEIYDAHQKKVDE